MNQFLPFSEKSLEFALVSVEVLVFFLIINHKIWSFYVELSGWMPESE